MRIFYDEISSMHDITNDWYVTSLSIILVSDSAEVLYEEHINNPFVWGNASLVYSLISPNHEKADYFNWQEVITVKTVELLESMVRHEEMNPTDDKIEIITWNGCDYLHPSLSDIPIVRVANLLNSHTQSLKDVCVQLGYPLKDLDTPERINAIKELYYSTIKLLK